MEPKSVYLIIEYPEPEEYSEGNSVIYGIATSRSKAEDLLAEANKDERRRFEIQEEKVNEVINITI